MDGADGTPAANKFVLERMAGNGIVGDENWGPMGIGGGCHGKKKNTAGCLLSHRFPQPNPNSRSSLCGATDLRWAKASLKVSFPIKCAFGHILLLIIRTNLQILCPKKTSFSNKLKAFLSAHFQFLFP
jgi:hypothetical protein